MIKQSTLTAQDVITGQSATLFKTIKGSAMNKERARVWVESAELAEFGFARGERIDITFHADHIRVELNESGKRKVAGRERGGRTICILDICFEDAIRDQMFSGAVELDVYAGLGVLIIKAGE